MSAAGSLFARLYSGHTGVDPYTTAVSDTYQDLFAEGIFTGKGLYDVDAFIAALEDSVPENALLSHDLFEGLHARVALVSDVELVDDYPSSVLSHARRQHRWVRGDWQILFWLFPFVPSRRGLKRNPLTAHRPLEDSRQPAPQPRGAGAAGAARRGLAVLPGSRCVLDGHRGGRRCVAAAAGAGAAAHRPRPLAVDSRLPHATCATTRPPRVAQVLLSLTLLAFHAFDSLHAIGVDAGAAGRDEAPAARMGNGGEHRGPGRRPRGQPRARALRRSR